MEILISWKYDHKFDHRRNISFEERIRLLHMGDVWMISVLSIEKMTRRFINLEEWAFDSLESAQKYLDEEIEVTMPDYHKPYLRDIDE